MDVRVFATPDTLQKGALDGKAAIVIDALRMTSVAATAMEHGCAVHENRGAAIKTMHYLTELLEEASVPKAFSQVYPINTRNFNDAGGGGLKHGGAIIQYIFHLAHSPERPWYAFLLLGFLRALSWLYGFGARASLWMYQHHFLPTKRLDCRVISIGNIGYL